MLLKLWAKHFSRTKFFQDADRIGCFFNPYCQILSKNLPDVSKNFPDVSKNFPDVSKNFPGYLFVKFSQTIFDQNHRICLSLKTFQNRVERTSVPEVCPCPSPCLRFSDMPVSEVMNLSESMSESDVLKNLVSESELEVKNFPGSESTS